MYQYCILIAQMPSAGAPQHSASADHLSSLESGATVLVVDDEAQLRTLITRFLQKLGYQTLSAADGQEACEILHRQSEQIDLVIFDYTMPDITGNELYAAIREAAPAARTILITGSLTLKGPASEGLIGIDSCLRKPFGLDELRVTVSGLIKQGLSVQGRGTIEA